MSDVATKVVRGLAEVERLAGECGDEADRWAVKRGVMEGLRAEIAALQVGALRENLVGWNGAKGGDGQ